MPVTLMATQSGSGSTVIHAQSGVTIRVANQNHDSQLAEANAHIGILTAITGVKFAFTAGGGAS